MRTLAQTCANPWPERVKAALSVLLIALLAVLVADLYGALAYGPDRYANRTATRPAAALSAAMHPAAKTSTPAADEALKRYLINLTLTVLIGVFFVFVTVVALQFVTIFEPQLVAPDCAVTVHDANGVAFIENGCPGSGD